MRGPPRTSECAGRFPPGRTPASSIAKRRCMARTPGGSRSWLPADLTHRAPRPRRLRSPRTHRRCPRFLRWRRALPRPSRRSRRPLPKRPCRGPGRPATRARTRRAGWRARARTRGARLENTPRVTRNDHAGVPLGCGIPRRRPCAYRWPVRRGAGGGCARGRGVGA
jgi:hypothetical protein